MNANKRNGLSREIGWGFVVLLIIVAILLFFLFSSGPIFPQKSEFSYTETIIVPLASEQEIYTESKYSGSVWLRISGTGHISDEVITDAFCTYNSNDFRPIYEERLQYGIAVDNDVRLFLAGPNVASIEGSLSRCQVDDHIYYLIYALGEQPRRISFRSADTSIEDNSGEFVVNISYQRPPDIRPPER